ncbi:MAG TPA: cytidine deaminase [Chitinophagaceae bacterium]|nr:cytidine deaminase [Chitinophagaceae bacterium]
MKQDKIEISYQLYDDISELNKEDNWLLKKAREVTKLAYAPYSRFQVAAVARMMNREIVTGSNQENASYPAGLCAERGLLAAAATLYPEIAIETMAISYHNLKGESNLPITPCGICRQSLREYEDRFHKSIKLILGGMEGKILIFEKASDLLPFAFNSKDMK